MMKRSTKRLLSGLFTAAFLFTGVSSVFAKDYSDVTTENPARDAIDILSDIGVIVGTSENEFSPEENVTREQMALLMFRLMLNKQNGGRVNTSPFNDLENDAYFGAISWANASGYILGTSASTFEPLEGITLQDAMTILVRALGHSTETMNNGYPWTYIDKAIQLGLDHGLEHMAYTETLTRAEAAMILFNAITAEYLVPMNHIGGIVMYESTTIIEKVFGYEMDEATLVATNDYTLTGNTVVKNGFVQLRLPDERTILVRFDELGLNGNANEYLGESFKLVYTRDAAGNQVSVLNAIPVTQSKLHTEIGVQSGSGTITVGGETFRVVENYSDSMTTNQNEIIVFAYENDKTLTPLTSASAVADRIGLYCVELIRDPADDSKAVAFLRNFEIGQLKISDDGKINIANNLDITKLTGGYSNRVAAENGEYVLYYFNAQTKELVIHDVLDMIRGTVTRVTATSAKINGITYALGNAKANIPADTIASALTVGGTAHVGVYNGAILVVVGETVVGIASNYLVALSEAFPVFDNGTFRYVITAIIDGKNMNLYVDTHDVKTGMVYRYVEKQGVYSLIPAEIRDGGITAGLHHFVQNGYGVNEIAWMTESADGTKLQNAGTFFTLQAGNAAVNLSENGAADMKFVMDSKTSILVNNNGTLQFVSGKLLHALTIHDGASVTAVFDNEVGSVETLRFLFVSDGNIGVNTVTQQAVRVLALTGVVYENGKTYAEYMVFNFAEGKVETRLSSNMTLAVNALLVLNSDGTISEAEGTVESGTVSGYTAGTVTIGTETYSINEATKIVSLSGTTAVNKTIADALDKTVEFVRDGSTVTLILIG